MLTYKEGDNFVSKELSIINQLLSDAKKELDLYRDYGVTSAGIQATEKLWGIMAHIIRLNQYLRGLRIPNSHSDNILYMGNLVSGKELDELQKRARKMHQRFYTGNFKYVELQKDYEYTLRKKNDFISKIQVR